ncbi:hypothetical protein [Brevundimonas sp.]|uniref:hypothetical protein n=1 Tax=Brevundimonas sp. TaxID=1871086 RepID=UPI003BAA84C1
MLTVLALAAALMLSPATKPAGPELASALSAQCRFTGEPRQWTAQALDAWARLDRERLRIDNPITPTIALFDQACVYRLTPDRRGDFNAGGRRFRTSAESHTGQVAIPDGSTVPAQRLAFAAPTSEGMFFIMALPALWRADGAERRDPRLLAIVVFMHEFTHTQQADGLGARVDRLLSLGLPEDANDDIVQDRFAGRPGYQAMWEAERDTLYRAVSAPDAGSARSHLNDGLQQMRERQARWFTGPDALYAEADDVFLTMEGTGNWSAWAWLTDPRGGRMSSADAIAFVRGGSGHWSQDEGLAIMLAVDRLLPQWPALAFGPRAATAEEMANRAVQPSRSRE